MVDIHKLPFHFSQALPSIALKFQDKLPVVDVMNEEIQGIFL